MGIAYSPLMTLPALILKLLLASSCLTFCAYPLRHTFIFPVCHSILCGSPGHIMFCSLFPTGTRLISIFMLWLKLLPSSLPGQHASFLFANSFFNFHLSFSFLQWAAYAPAYAYCFFLNRRILPLSCVFHY